MNFVNYRKVTYMNNDFDNRTSSENEDMVNSEEIKIETTQETSQESAQTDSMYRMKFERGQNSQGYTSYGNYNSNNMYGYNQGYTQNYGSNQNQGNENSYNNYNNYNHYNPYANDYSYYQQPAGTKKRKVKTKKSSSDKKNSFGRQFVKVVCFGLVFGLVAGGAMFGVNMLGGVFKKDVTVQEPTPSNAIETGYTVGIVKVSSADVQMFEATDVSDIVEEVKPSVVAVTTVVEKTYEDFFGRPYSQEGSGAGSGIIFSESNNLLYLVTNYHVIEDARDISITFNDDSQATAQLKGYDSDGDIAVLTVDMSQLSAETKAAIKIAVLGDSDVIREGSGAIAIGNALGYGQSTTTGTISAVEREVQLTDGMMTLIQTDAAINPGNSGGALLNARGEVIGINTVKFSDTSVEGMGYAIPINRVVETVGDIISGKIKTDADKAMLGIQGGTVSEDDAATYGWPQGVYVAAVVRNSAAQRAGLEAGYIIVGFNGTEITTMEELQELIEQCAPGDRVTLDVMVPNYYGEYDTEAQTLQTLMGSVADSNR